MSKKLAIIGGGPGGLGTARVFLNNSSNFHIDIFESDYDVGGVWHYNDDDKDDRTMYDHLEANLSKDLMKFSGFPFEDRVATFPKRLDIWKYLKNYYETYIKGQKRCKIHLNTEVTCLKKIDNHWQIEYKDKNEHGRAAVETFDFVVIANGHFSTPALPNDVPGLNEWFETGSALHSKDFQNCEFTKGKTVVVVGNSSSGSDIVTQVSTVAKKVYNSVTSPPGWGGADPNDVNTIEVYETIPRITSADLKNHTISLEDGTLTANVDYLIYATGYLYSLPFVERSLRTSLLGKEIIAGVSSTGIHGLWKDIFYIEDPTLAFSLLPQMVIPFPLAELQAAVMVKVFTSAIKVPKTLTTDEENVGHKYPDFADFGYYDDLQSILDKSGGDKDPLKPIKWDTELKNARIKSGDDKRLRNILLTNHAIELKRENKPYALLRQ